MIGDTLSLEEKGETFETSPVGISGLGLA